MYRILAANQPVRERRNQRSHPCYTKPELVATGPNQTWSWDITRLRGPKRWTSFYLYVLDLQPLRRGLDGCRSGERRARRDADRGNLSSKASSPRCSPCIHRGAPMTSKCTDSRRDYAASGSRADCVLHDPRHRWRHRHRPARSRWGAGLRELYGVHVVHVVDEPMRPSKYPDNVFTLVKVSYGGKCEVECQKQGQRIRAATMQRVAVGQIVFSTIRATDGAIGIVPPDLDGALVSGSYTVFRCDVPHDAAYLWSVLRSYELRADMQSLSPGSGRYTTYWPKVGQLLIPWPSEERRKEIGDGLIELWEEERELMMRRQRALAHLDILGIESAESRRRWSVSKAPQ